MSGVSKPSAAEQRRLINDEIGKMDSWSEPRMIAYRRERDFWQLITYGLLALSAATAIGAAISAGLKVPLWSIIFAGVSAGLSVIHASLKTPKQIAKSEAGLERVATLRADIQSFKTDLPGLAAQNLTRRLDQLRKDYKDALKLPQPSERRLIKAFDVLKEAPSLGALLTGVIRIP